LKKIKIEASVFLLAAILLVLAGGVVAAGFVLRSNPVEEALSVDRVINVLFVFEKDSKPLGSYVLMYYPVTGRAAVFDIPGDLGLIISRIKRVDRIDRIFNPQKTTEFVEEIERLLGINIAFSVVITTENLGKIVDLLEGVELFIPAQIQTDDGGSPVMFSSGLSRLDGDKASLYISYEGFNEDRDAIASRRQRFFTAFIKQLGIMNETLKNFAVGRLFHSYLNTAMSQRTRTRLFDEFSHIDVDRIAIQTVGGNLREVSGQTLLLPYYDGNLIKEIVRQTLGSLTRRVEGTLSERVFTVEILNGTAVNGLAGRTAELLRGFGYDVISTGNADRNNYEKTIIYNRSGYEDIAQIFAGIIRCNNVQSEMPLPTDPGSADVMEDLSMYSIDYRADFTLIIGRDFNGRYVSGN
jgi:anionic cell wall polymer biosynthesis LytR-Cps2A-Psr (LCP) family protein